eukprot:2003304-Pyramimonas_sp.AAC.1
MAACRPSAAQWGSKGSRGIRKYLGGKLNSPMVVWPNRGLTDSSQLGRFFRFPQIFGGRFEFSSGGVPN